MGPATNGQPFGYHPIPEETRRAHAAGLTPPGTPKPLMSNSIITGDIEIIFTEQGIFLKTDKPFLKKQLENAAASVGNRTVRISSSG
ncbi:MAG: hypothetical protein RLZZ480_390 [Candidatus Parcubacteria bacterium]|jgi:hypothetical protein